MKVGEIELLDREAEGIKGSPFFRKTGKGKYIYDDEATRKLVTIYGFTKIQREAYVWYFQVFKFQEIYSSDSERLRRVALAMYGDRTYSKNLRHTVKGIKEKIEKADRIAKQEV